MMFKRLVVFCVLFCSWLTVSHAANTVEQIRVVEHADKTRIVLELNKKPLLNIYSRAKSSQIVIDLARTNSKVSAWKFAKQSSNITRIEQSKNKADTRFIFHLAQLRANARSLKNFFKVNRTAFLTNHPIISTARAPSILGMAEAIFPNACDRVSYVKSFHSASISISR